jgi:threonine synthase
MSEYISTRASGDVDSRSYSDILLEGLAPDRGLYVPIEYPEIDIAFLKNLQDKPYTEQFVAVKSLFVGDSMDLATQKTLAEAAYTDDKFPEAQNGVITPVRKVVDNLFIQNLSLGPTAAFKDMALQALGQDMQHELVQRGQRLRILGATSGDTGSAAEAALKGLDNVDLFMLSPQHGMTRFQQAQMAELSGGNIYNIAADVRFDVLQSLVKDLKQDPEFADLGAVNSINWGRVASQVPYYFAGYLQTVGDEIGKEVDFVVPSGNMGNALAGHIARKMGLPIRRIIIATNENSVLNKLIHTGRYEQKDPKITSSPSMDITSASNYERVVHDLMGSDSALTSEYMSRFEREGHVAFADLGLDNDLLRQSGFESGKSKHGDRINSIQWVRSANADAGVIDPHTADGITVAMKLRDPNVPTIVMETALPVKFEDTVREALGSVPDRPARFRHTERALGRDAVFWLLAPDRLRPQLERYIRQNSPR